jgi:hypothetical protein
VVALGRAKRGRKATTGPLLLSLRCYAAEEVARDASRVAQARALLCSATSSEFRRAFTVLVELHESYLSSTLLYAAV